MNAIPKILEPRWERRKDARPGELASAALELFIERGFSATRLDDVAKRAGVSKGTLYLYFDSKEDLFKAVVREGILPKFVEFEEEARTFTGSTPDLLRGLVHRWWDQIGATHLGGITKLMMSEAGNFPELAKFYHDEVITRGLGIFSAVIQRGVTRGEFRPLAMEYAPRICAAPVLMLMLWRHSFDLCGAQQLDPKAYLDTHIDMLVHSLSSNVHEPIAAAEKRSATR